MFRACESIRLSNNRYLVVEATINLVFCGEKITYHSFIYLSANRDEQVHSELTIMFKKNPTWFNFRATAPSTEATAWRPSRSRSSKHYFVVGCSLLNVLWNGITLTWQFQYRIYINIVWISELERLKWRWAVASWLAWSVTKIPV